MSPFDVVNGSFELLASFFVAVSARRVWVDRHVAGVSWVTTAFFTAWGFWNVIWYPHLGQPVSFAAGFAVVAANLVWVVGLVKYRRGR